ncbi:MAG TPA: Crp/Fnr family transcriptional regulator [Microscillaceae bacterium]|nr:Crp/Fnr family transcriptional regulator [Microscillaceae bacterium]
MDNLLKYIRSLTAFSDESWEILQSALTKQVFKKGEYLLSEGQVCNTLFYIDEGYCKSCYLIDGTFKNTDFFFEDEIVTNINSFGKGEKSTFNIISCEPLTAILFDKQKLITASQQSNEIEVLRRKGLQLSATKQEKKSMILQLFSTQERLEYYEKECPELLQRVPLSQLASFLGVTRETLSRIRKRRAP